MDIAQTIQQIQYVLAPAIMVSSSALLLLGLQAKFSNLANRFRALNHEKRLLTAKAGRDQAEESRLQSLQVQVESLLRRATHVKNAILLSYVGIVCFTGTSVLIFLNVYAAFELRHCVILVFMIGLLAILAASILMIVETRWLYRILTLEKTS